MRENRPYGSEGGEADAFPTPIVHCAKLRRAPDAAASGFAEPDGGRAGSTTNR